MSEPEAQTTPDSEGKDYVVLDEILPEDIHLLDQPPYTWAREDPDIIPEDFFTEEYGWYIFCDAVLGYKGTGVGGKLRESLEEYDYMNQKKYDRKEIMRIAKKFKSTLDDKYPLASNYVQNYGEFFTFVTEPKKRKTDKHFEVLTYPAYVDRVKEAGEAAKWVGIEEERPSAYSTSEEAREAMPAKSRANKQFRLLKSIGLKK